MLKLKKIISNILKSFQRLMAGVFIKGEGQCLISLRNLIFIPTGMSFVVPFHWVSPKTQIEAKQATPTLTRQNLEDQGKNKGLSTECENEMDLQLPALY